MAARTAVVRNVIIERGPDDARGSAIDSIGTLKRATIYFDNNGIVVTGGTDTLDLDMETAIEGSLRNGKTVTVRTCCISQALTTKLLASPYTEVTHAGFITAAISSGSISITPKSDGYLTGSTNSTIAASATVENARPYAVYCTFTEAWSVDEEQTSAADGSRVANVCEAVVMLAALGGMDVTAARSITLDFDPSGDVTVTLTTTDGATDEATITAADIRAASDLDADHERESTPPPPAA